MRAQYTGRERPLTRQKQGSPGLWQRKWSQASRTHDTSLEPRMSYPSLSGVSVWFGIPADAEGVRRVNTEAFGRLAEANLVDALRRAGQVVISLVAEIDKEVVGHVVLTPVTLTPTVPGLRMLGIGPVAVLPKYQRKGIGFKLVRQAVDQARAEGWQAVVVLGRPEYYRRFGFVPASRYGLGCEFNAPADSFQVLELQPGALKGLHGVVRYQPGFSLV